jgi:hypothetical protein
MLDAKYWSQRAANKKNPYSFTANYYNYFLNNLLVKHNLKGKILKVDLWNESVATERNVLQHFSDEVYGCDIGHVQAEKGASYVATKICSSNKCRSPQKETLKKGKVFSFP